MGRADMFGKTTQDKGSIGASNIGAGNVKAAKIKTVSIKGRLFGTLFALPFAGVGVWMLVSITGTLLDARDMRGWSATEAELIRAGYETRSGDDSDTYEAYADYRYTYLGRPYAGSRVTTSSGGDNIGRYQQDIGNRLRAALSRGEPITVYVDPDDPSQSVIDRNVRWGLLGFKAIFLLVFGGIGFGLLYAMFRSPRAKDTSRPEYQSAPWLLNDRWQNATVRSSSKLAMWGAWGFAALWNLISAFLPFVAYDEVVNKQNYAALLALLFPAIGLGLLIWAIRRTLEWRRFGPAPVTLDPYPGAIGGHVGGTIDINLPYDPTAVFEFTLTNVRSYLSGSGKNRSRRENAKWQDRLVAHAEPGSRGTRLTFRFDVPEGLGESDAQQDEDSYHLWRLNVKADLPGTDFNRDYELPVFATGERSRRLAQHAVERTRAQTGDVGEQVVRNLIKLVFGPTGKSMRYPMFRNLGSGFGGLLFGAIFAGAGGFLAFGEGHYVFGGIFGLIGILIVTIGLYMMLNSLEVSDDGGSIRTVRRVLGIPVVRQALLRHAFTGFDKKSSMQSKSGNKHAMYYTVHALDDAGNKITVGEGFKGAGEAEAAMRLFAREFGLGDVDTREPSSNSSSALSRNESPEHYGADVLTTDR